MASTDASNQPSGQAAPDPRRSTGQHIGIAVPPELHRSAVGVLLGGGGTAPTAAVRNFLTQAPDLGIDLNLLAAAVDADDPEQTIRQVCLSVVGPGRTLMLFVSGGLGGGPPDTALLRATAIRTAVQLACAAHGAEIHLVQALTHPRERWAMTAYEAAGLHRLAELHYIARTLQPRDAGPEPRPGETIDAPDWPPGIVVRAMGTSHEDEAALRVALEASYEDTQDCPELAGMRSLDDIVAAHRGVGEYDPALWWLVEHRGTPCGGVLLNRCPAQSCVELVYIGVAPHIRGLGLGRMLLQRAIAAVSAQGRELRCAVDARNTPARTMYKSLGFRETERRVAYVALARDVLKKQGNSRGDHAP